jgi:hypothetical protein
MQEAAVRVVRRRGIVVLAVQAGRRAMRAAVLRAVLRKVAEGGHRAVATVVAAAVVAVHPTSIRCGDAAVERNPTARPA